MIWKLMVPPLSQKVAIFTNLRHGWSQKVGCFFLLSQFYELAFQKNCWLLQSNKEGTRNTTLSLFLAVDFLNFAQILFERTIFTKEAP